MSSRAGFDKGGEQEITASAQEQSAGVDLINLTINQFNQDTQRNASVSEELAAEEWSAQEE